MDRQKVLTMLKNRSEDIQKKFSVRTLSIFGSTARNETTEASDVDVLVTFEQKPDFDMFMDLKFYLEDLLGTKVDLVTENALRPQIRQMIKKELIDVA